MISHGPLLLLQDHGQLAIYNLAGNETSTSPLRPYLRKKGSGVISQRASPPSCESIGNYVSGLRQERNVFQFCDTSLLTEDSIYVILTQ